MSTTPEDRPRVSGRGAGPGRPPVREIRAWARDNGIQVARTGGLPRFVYDLYQAAQPVSRTGTTEAVDQ